MSRSFLADKRGVSEVISSLSILLIVTVVGAGLYAFGLAALNSSGSAFSLQINEREDRAQERLVITTVWWNTSNNYLNITILNYGKIEVVIDAVYIDGTQVSASAFIDGKGTTVATENLVSVKLTSPVSIVDGETYEVVAVTKRGSRDVVYWEA